MLCTYMYRITKKEAMPDLPEKLYSDYRLVMLPEQHNIYHKVENIFVETMDRKLKNGGSLNALLSVPNIVAQIIRLRQICLTPQLVGGPSVSAKIDALREIFEDIDGRFIVFSCFRGFLPLVAELLCELGIEYGEIVGGQSGWERAKVEKALNSGDIQGVLGTIQSMGEGLNLQAASTAIFCDIDWVPAVNYQAEDRIHRGDISISPTIIRLFHPGTIESDIRVACKRKERIIEETVGRVEVIREMLLRKGVRIDV